MISKQKALYELAGLELAQSSPTVQVKEVNENDAEMAQEDETSQEFDWQFEAIEETPMFEDEEMASEFISEADEQESSETAAAVIKIEKVQENEETAIENVFDFFEEIVGESDGEREEKYETAETEAESESQEMSVKLTSNRSEIIKNFFSGFSVTLAALNCPNLISPSTVKSCTSLLFVNIATKSFKAKFHSNDTHLRLICRRK